MNTNSYTQLIVEKVTKTYDGKKPVGGKGGGGQGVEMTQALYAHMNSKTMKK
jgi:hypothetical protein